MKLSKLLIGLTAGALLSAAAPAYAGSIIQVSSLADDVDVTFAQIQQDQRWTKDNVYILDKLIYVNNGAVLTIEPGTIIRGEDANSDELADPGALIIDRGAKLIANGTPEEPIIFTSLQDPYVPAVPGLPEKQITVYEDPANLVGPTQVTVPGSVPNDAQQDLNGLQPLPLQNYAPDGPEEGSFEIGGNGFSKQGLWGGIIILGRTRTAWNNLTGNDWDPNSELNPPVNNDTDGEAPDLDEILSQTVFTGTQVTIQGDDPTVVDPNSNAPAQPGFGAQFIEGLDRRNSIGIYGGDVDDDNSGVMRFVSIRYPGFNLSADNEINAWTGGAVGSETVLEYMETYNSRDDCYENFGGTVNMKYCAALYGDDDGFDRAQGYHGDSQFLLHLQNNAGQREYGDPNNRTETGRDTLGGNVGEYSGPQDPDSFNGKPFSAWKIFNGTWIGYGPGGVEINKPAAVEEVGSNRGPEFRENGAGKIYQSVLTQFVDAGLRIRGSQITTSDAPVFDNSNLSVSQLFVYERDFGGEFNFADVAAAAGEADGIFRNNMWWDAGVSGGVDSVDDLKEFLIHGGFTGFSSAGASNNPSPIDLYFLDSLVQEAGLGGQAIDIDGDGNTDGTINANRVQLPFIGDFNTLGADAGYFTSDHGNTLNENPDLVAIYRLNNNGTAPDTFDPRIQENGGARTPGAWGNPLAGDQPLPDDNDFYTPVSFRGAFQDNLWLKGWSIIDRQGDHPYAGMNVLSAEPNPGAPAPSISLDGSNNLVVSFAVAAADVDVQYSIERSSDRKTFTPIAVVSDGAANDEDADAESVSFTDLGQTLQAGDDPVIYRVIPL